MDVPETKYARAGDVHIAYQVVGNGPLDLIFVPNWAHPIELMWHQPPFERFLKRLASFSRLICFDKRGSGASDRGRDPTVATLEGWMDDISLVTDAVGSEKAAILGYDTGGPLAILFAASNPERTTALVLYGTFASGAQALDETMTRSRQHPMWGQGGRLEQLAPSAAQDPRLRSWWGQFERAGNSPEPANAVFRMIFESDVRHVLPVIHVPTLVLHRTGDRFIDVANGRNLRDEIPGAEYLESPGENHLPWLGDSDAITGEIERFITGVRPSVESDRVLATVLFTDIVASTEKESTLGDRRWRDLLDRHDKLALEQIERFRGRLVKSTGDGLLATFDGPARGVRCAREIESCLRELGIEIRAGLHTGEIELRGEDVTGIAVTIARRICDSAATGEQLVSRTVTDLVAGSGLEFEDRSERELKGVPGRWQLYAVS
jgi:class 3 adenylate cyclase